MVWNSCVYVVRSILLCMTSSVLEKVTGSSRKIQPSNVFFPFIASARFTVVDSAVIYTNKRKYASKIELALLLMNWGGSFRVFFSPIVCLSASILFLQFFYVVDVLFFLLQMQQKKNLPTWKNWIVDTKCIWTEFSSLVFFIALFKQKPSIIHLFLMIVRMRFFSVASMEASPSTTIINQFKIRSCW